MCYYLNVQFQGQRVKTSWRFVCGLRHKTRYSQRICDVKEKVVKSEINFCPSVRTVGLVNRRLADFSGRIRRTICVVLYHQRIQGQGQGNVRINTIRIPCLRMVRISPLISSLPVPDNYSKMSVLRDGSL